MSTIVHQEPQTRSQASLRASCDSCRRRKLKCSGEGRGCAKCLANNIECTYTPRASIGRPRKLYPDAGADNERPRKRSKNAAPEDSGTAHIYYGGPDFALDFQPNDMADALEFSHPVDTTGTEASQHIASNFEQPEYLNQMLAIDPMLEDLDTSMNLAGDAVHPLRYSSQPAQPSQPSSLPYNTANISISPAPIPAFSISRTPPSLPCACVANHYLITSRLHSVSDTSTTTAAIAQRLSICRDALHTAEGILNCTHCPSTQMTGSHNVMILLSLLSGIAHAYEKLFDDVREEAEGLIARSADTELQLSELPRRPTTSPDSRPSSTSYHNADTDGTELAQATPEDGGLAIRLTGAVWRDLVLAAIHREIFAPDSTLPIVPQQPPPDPNLDQIAAIATTARPRLTLESLITMMEARQKQRHATMTPEIGEQAQNQCDKDGHACLKMVGYVRSIVDGLRVSSNDVRV